MCTPQPHPSISRIPLQSGSANQFYIYFSIPLESWWFPIHSTLFIIQTSSILRAIYAHTHRLYNHSTAVFYRWHTASYVAWPATHTGSELSLRTENACHTPPHNKCLSSIRSTLAITKYTSSKWLLVILGIMEPGKQIMTTIAWRLSCPIPYKYHLPEAR